MSATDYLIGAVVGGVLATIFSRYVEQPVDPQYYYEEVYRGEVACFDTPDKKIYCYKTDKNERRGITLEQKKTPYTSVPGA